MSPFILLILLNIVPLDLLGPGIFLLDQAGGRRKELITRASQKERIELITVALTNRVGKDALSHYGLDPDPKTDSSPTERRTGGPEVEVEVEPGSQAEVEDGLHL
jgi:hypothetical protein